MHPKPFSPARLIRAAQSGIAFDFADDCEIHIWLFATELEVRERNTFRELLSLDERERAVRFKFERDRERFIAARGSLRVILAAYESLQPEALLFGQSTHGKPELRNGRAGVGFNLSHSKSYAVLGVTPGRHCGIDLERIDAGRSLDALAEHVFHPEESQWIRSIAESGRAAAFFRVWTLKEAIVKAIGRGLSLLDHVNVTPLLGGASETIRVQIPDSPRETFMRVREIPLVAGFASAVAAAGDAIRPRDMCAFLDDRI
jgi:4'-phosphopantetheinyl transferase